MVDRTGQNAIFALSDGTNRRTAPPVPTGASTSSQLAAYLQGSTTFPFAAGEITLRAKNLWQVWTNPVVGYAAADYTAAIAAVKAVNPSSEIGAYTIPQELPATKPGGVYGAIWQSATNANWFARPNWPGGAQISMGGGFVMMNEAITAYNRRYIDAVLTDMSLPVDAVMTDDTSPNAFASFDVNQDGNIDGAGSTTVQTAYIAGMQDRHDYLASNGKKYIENGSIGWWIDAVGGATYASRLTMFHKHIYEMLWGNYASGTAVSFGRVFYAGNPGTIPSLSNVLTYPAGAAVSVDPPIGTVLQTKFGGWMKDAGGNNIYTNGALSRNCARAALEWAIANIVCIDANHLCVQVRGPHPNRFNNPFGSTGVWANADKHARSVTLSTSIFTNYQIQYVGMEQTSNLGTQLVLDEFAFFQGTPDTTNLGQAQALVDWGSGKGNGYSKGVYVRKWIGNANGANTLDVWNPPGNGPQTIILPPGNWRHIKPSDWGGSVAQATVNDGSAVSSTFTIQEHDAYRLVDGP